MYNTLHNVKKARPNYLTDKPNQLELIVIAVYLLGGVNKSVDTEDVAVKCHELAPGLFSWRKYPEQINLEIVRVVLSNGKKPANGALLSGSGRDGWRLAANGLDWMTSRGQAVLDSGRLGEDREPTRSGSIDQVRLEREKRRLQSTPAWRSWNAGSPLSYKNACQVFRVDDYASDRLLDVKVVRLRALLEHDEQFGNFIRKADEVLREGDKL